MARKSIRIGPQLRAVPPSYEQRLARLSNSEAIAGVSGPGHWLVIEYYPTSLFSLKISMATSSVGKTLLVPTPYAIKMAFVDAAFRADISTEECAEFLESLIGVAISIASPQRAVVTHTFVKIRQEPHDPAENPFRPYIGSMAYREYVHYQGSWRWAFDLTDGDDKLAERLVHIAPYINYIGKRGSFIQYSGMHRLVELGAGFTQCVDGKSSFILPQQSHIVPLDDFGPEASLLILNSYTTESAKRDKHRKYVNTLVPLGITNTGSGFTEYSAGDILQK